MCVRSDHRGRSRSVDNVSKVVRVMMWSKVVNGQKVVNSGQWSESYIDHFHFDRKKLSVCVWVQQEFIVVFIIVRGETLRTPSSFT